MIYQELLLFINLGVSLVNLVRHGVKIYSVAHRSDQVPLVQADRERLQCMEHHPLPLATEAESDIWFTFTSAFIRIAEPR